MEESVIYFEMMRKMLVEPEIYTIKFGRSDWTASTLSIWASFARAREEELRKSR
jgi:hypothetical protein